MVMVILMEVIKTQILITFPTEMRVAPTSLDTSGTSSDYFIRVTTNVLVLLYQLYLLELQKMH